MGTQLDHIDESTAKWMQAQHIFFVATAPISATGHVNCSPKGLDSFRILRPDEVAYLDLTGSGAETIAHVRENGRIVLMFCAFEGKPRIVRLYGQGRIVLPESEEFVGLAELFGPRPGTRSIIVVKVNRVTSSCGFAVPLMDFRQDRETLDKYSVAKGEKELEKYRKLKNAKSIDGLPALSPKA